jgi:hypothetical protein
VSPVSWPSRPPVQRILVAAALAASVAAPAAAHAADPVSGDPVVTAVGDMACDAADPSFSAGAGTTSRCAEERVSGRMFSDVSVDALLGLGDFQYDCGDPSDYAVSYAPSWGRFDPITYPIAGNHEYKTGSDVFGAPCPAGNSGAESYFDYFGPASHPRTEGHFAATRFPGWLLLGLNANCSRIGGCGEQSRETAWLRTTLASATQPCILAFWHQPRWSALGARNDASYGPWWSALRAARADLVLNGHSHSYQRYGLLSPAGAADPAGLREIVVGTGGEKLAGPAPTSGRPTPLASARTFGYLRLVLHPGAYDWQFVRSDGRVLDRGTQLCH